MTATENADFCKIDEFGGGHLRRSDIAVATVRNQYWRDLGLTIWALRLYLGFGV